MQKHLMRRWYAIEHRYGSNVCDNDGDHIGEVFAFPTKAQRDAWCADGHDFIDQSGYREALRFSDRRDKTAIRRFQRQGSD